MIIWGWRGREIEQERGQFHCPQCNASAEYKKVRVATYFTLYFIPLFETRHHGDYIECMYCRGQFKPTALKYSPTFQAPTGSSRVTVGKVNDLPMPGYEARIASDKVENAKRLVKGPAVAMLVAGFLGLAMNLFTATVGIVNEFVIPVDAKKNGRKAAVVVPAAKAEENKKEAAVHVDEDKGRDPASVVETAAMFLGFAAACGIAIWAGFSMLNLRRYWLSMAGSFAVMIGACVCCLAGIPIGVWSLVVLVRSDVSSAFT